MNQSNSTLAKRIADLERQLSNTKNTANTLLEENKQLLIELASVKDLLESSQLCEATAKQYAEEVDKQNAALAAQVEALQKTVVSVKARCNILQNLTLQLIQGAELSGSDWDYISEAQATEIQHHLRQVRADAGRDGFIAGYMLCNDGSPLIKHNYEGMADKYHASILAGKE